MRSEYPHNPELAGQQPFKNYLFEQIEHFFVVAFALEMTIKVIAKGLFV